MEENGHIPKFLGKINKSIISHVLPLHLMQLSAWLWRHCSVTGVLAAVISTATLVAYLTGPTTVISLRKMAPK